MQYVIGLRYVDDVILHREDGDVDGTYDETWYHLSDVQYSTVAILDDAAALVERVSYDPVLSKYSAEMGLAEFIAAFATVI